jgi:NADH:ubiquinone oxidoreductase subunit 6 (subunit J)
MRGLSALAQIGVLGFMLILLSEVMSHSMWGGSGDAPSTLDFAVALFGEWWGATVVLGALLAMAMIGASYLVRDERLANLIWDLEGDDQ